MSVKYWILFGIFFCGLFNPVNVSCDTLIVEEIVVAFDKDEAGKKAQHEFVKELEKLEEFKVTAGQDYPPLQDFYRTEYKDVNEYYVKEIYEKSVAN